MSCSVQMCGWFSAATARASRSKRSPNWAEETLIATIRSRRVSLARYTSPIPPAPICVRISYGPRRAPAESDIRNVERFYLTRACGGRASATIGGAGLAHGEQLLSFGFLPADTLRSGPLHVGTRHPVRQSGSVVGASDRQLILG